MPSPSVLEHSTPSLVPPLAPAAMLAIARELARDAATRRALARHHARERWFRRLVEHHAYDVWLIGWASYQRVDLHDHGGSSGALSVVEGELLESSGRRGGGGELPDQRLVAGTARAFGAGHVHRVVNPRAAVATSLHVYSPPLVRMDFYERDTENVLNSTHTEPALASRSGPGELR